MAGKNNIIKTVTYVICSDATAGVRSGGNYCHPEVQPVGSAARVAVDLLKFAGKG
jgi:hypothetical protein